MVNFRILFVDRRLSRINVAGHYKLHAILAAMQFYPICSPVMQLSFHPVSRVERFIRIMWGRRML